MNNLIMLGEAELRSRRESLRAELAPLAQRSEPTPEESNRFDSLSDSLEAIDAELERRESDRAGWLAEKAAAIRSGIASGSVRTESGFSAPEVMVRKGDPFAELDETTFRTAATPDLVGRARTAAERVHDSTDVGREKLTRLLDVEDQGRARLAAEYTLATGAPAYMRAFKKWVQNPTLAHQMWTPEEAGAWRAALSLRAALSTSNAGAIIPQQLDPTVILTSDGSSNPFRQIARVEQGFSNQWEGAVSAGITAEWKSEGAEMADATPTISSKTVPAESAAAYAFASYEILGDSNFGEQIVRLMADAKDNLEADAFAIGSGSGAPTGVVTAVAAVTASRVDPTTGGAFAIDDVYSTIEAVPARHRGRSSWVAEYSVLNRVRKMDSTGGGGEFWTNLTGNTPASLLGRPVYESSEMDSAVTTGSNILLAGDFSEYLCYDRIGMSLMYEPIVKGANQRPTAQAGFVAFWRVGGDVLNANAFRVLQL